MNLRGWLNAVFHRPKSSKEQAMDIWQQRDLSALDKFKALDQFAAERFPDSGKACPVCGKISYSSYMCSELGKPNVYGYAPVFQFYVWTNCGHVDESHPKIATYAVKIAPVPPQQTGTRLAGDGSP